LKTSFCHHRPSSTPATRFFANRKPTARFYRQSQNRGFRHGLLEDDDIQLSMLENGLDFIATPAGVTQRARVGYDTMPLARREWAVRSKCRCRQTVAVEICYHRGRISGRAE
jgi:hypothetical protein